MITEHPASSHPLVLSYLGVRRAIGLSGMLLPIVLGPVGWLVLDIDIQNNMSSYYHTPLRDVFVGTLSAMGIFLFCYRGHDRVENWTANIGCVTALGVALCPLDPQSDPLLQSSVAGYLHTLSGGAFFLTLAFYSLYHFPSARPDKVEPEPHVQQRNLVYRASGIVILLAMLAMGGYLFLLPGRWRKVSDDFNVLFWLEWIALWAFASAWLIKGRTLGSDMAMELVALAQQHLPHHRPRSS